MEHVPFSGGCPVCRSHSSIDAAVHTDFAISYDPAFSWPQPNDDRNRFEFYCDYVTTQCKEN
jgi:hypothetical protein